MQFCYSQSQKVKLLCRRQKGKRMKKKVIVIGGATASGKTNLSIQLAKEINGEIISADSMQVYKKMNIGTAKPTKAEMCGVKHYMIDELYPDEDFSVAIFKNKAKSYLEEVLEKGCTPIITGGTGFYINALLRDTEFVETETDYNYRDKLYKLAEKEGNEFVHNILKEIDEESAHKIHYNNVKRVVRAIEYCKMTGEKMSTHNKREKEKESPYDVKFILLDMDRNELYNRINLRVDTMLENGLVKEVAGLLEEGYESSLLSMQGLGYKEIAMYLRNEVTLEESIEMIKQGTRNFAKRQITWFKNQTTGIWMNTDNVMEQVLEKI